MSFRFDDSHSSSLHRASGSVSKPDQREGRTLKTQFSFGDLLQFLPEPPKTNSLKYYIMGVAVCVVFFAMPLVRIRFAGEKNAPIAAAMYWLPSNVANCIIVMYPWYTVVGRDDHSYLRTFYAISIPFITILALLGLLAELFIPKDPMHGFEPDKVSDTYRWVTGVRWTWSFIAGYIVAPMLLMRSSDRFEAKKRLLLYFVVFPCILFAYFALMMRDLTGNNEYMATAAWVVLVWVTLLIYDRNADCETDPTYIVLTAFMITSLTFTAGTMMLGWFQVATPFGKLFVLVVWEAMVFLVRHVVARSAALATNTDQSSAFVFNVVLAGEMYSEFVFLTIDFNTLVFWGLLVLSMASVIISEGGLLDDLDLWLKVSFVPWLKRVVLCSMEEPEPIPLEVKAHTLRHQWRINDLTMIAEFVALCSGVCCVLFEYIYHQSNIGADTLTYEYPPGERVDQLKVFGVLACGVLCAQLVARLMIRRKVTEFKLEVLRARGRVVEEPPSRLSDFIDPFVDRLSEVMEQVNPYRRNSFFNRERRAESMDAVEVEAATAAVDNPDLTMVHDQVEQDSAPVASSQHVEEATLDVERAPPDAASPSLRKNITVDNADLQPHTEFVLPLKPSVKRPSSIDRRHRTNSDIGAQLDHKRLSGRFNLFEPVDLETAIQRTLDEVDKLIGQDGGDVELATRDTAQPQSIQPFPRQDQTKQSTSNANVGTKRGQDALDGDSAAVPMSPLSSPNRQSLEGGKFIESLRRHETHELDLKFWRTHFHYFVATVAFTVINVIYRVVQLNYEL